MVFDPGATHASAPVPWLDEPGWSAEDDELEWERRRPRAIRVIGAVTVIALVLATIGATVGELLGGTSGPDFPARIVSSTTTARDGVHPGSGKSEAGSVITFQVQNDSSDATKLACEVQVYARGSVVESSAVLLGRILNVGEIGTGRVLFARLNPTEVRSAGVLCVPEPSTAAASDQPA
jgi:hypothetical protein